MIVMQKSFDKKKINIIMIVRAHRCLQTTIDYCGIAQPGHNSKSGLPVKAVFHFGYIISSVHLPTVSNHCKNLALPFSPLGPKSGGGACPPRPPGSKAYVYLLTLPN